MDFDNTFKAVSASADALATRLADIADKGSPMLSLPLQDAPGHGVIRVFAAGSDVDPDGIFGTLLHPTPGVAWVKLELGANASRKTGRTDHAAKFAASAKADAGTGAYLRSPSAATLAQALRPDGGIPFVLDVDDMRRLAPGHAAYAVLAGALSAKLEFNWADVLAGPITPLQALVPGDKPVNLVVDFKAGLAATITINDSFRLVFHGVDEDYVAVSLRRASGKGFAVKAGATATVRLEKPDMARGLLAQLAAQLLDVDAARINAWREHLESVLDLHDAAIERIRAEVDGAAEILDAAIDEIGMPALLTRLEQLQAISRWIGGGKSVLAIGQVAKAAAIVDQLAATIAEHVGDKLDELLASLELPRLAKKPTAALRGLLDRLGKIESALLEMARTRIELGLDFEYRRISSESSVLRARLRRDHADFADWHRSLLGLDAARVLGATQPVNRNVVLDSFLHQASIKRSISLGMDLGWFYSDKDSAETQWATSTRMVGNEAASPAVERSLVLMGTRSRVENALGTPSKCGGQFDGRFIASGAPDGPGHWSFALNLAYASATPRADRRWLLALADYACVWGVIGESEIDWLVGTLEGDGAIGRRMELEIALTINRAAFANPVFFKSFGMASDADVCRALAIALQRMEQFPERATPTSRAATYAEAVAVLLGRSGIDVIKAEPVARFVSRHLINASRDLKAFEDRSSRPIPAGSVAYLTQHTGSVQGVIRQFRETGTLQRLAGVEADGSDAERKLVSNAFRGLDLAWRDRFLLRWQVALLRALAGRVGVSQHMRATLKVTTANGKVRVIAPRATKHLLA